MLREIAEQLDAWVVARNLEARDEGLPTLRPCTIKLLGQMALLESAVPLTLAATNDVDVQEDYPHAVEQELARLLARSGKELDPLGHAIWMPAETRYRDLFRGQLVTLQVADADAVLLSKARMAPVKNKPLILEYLARGPSERFLALASKYGVDLESFL
jgi:hypothetical protein